jgi:integrase/recombinase XerD
MLPSKQVHRPEMSPNFTAARPKAKLVGQFARLVRRHRLDYAAFTWLCREVRKETGLRRPARRRRLPRLVPDSTLRAFYEAVDRAGDLKHQIMLRLLFYTAVRVSELVSMMVADVDLDAGKIFIEHGKGDKDRYILFPESFRLLLKAYITSNPGAVYLFESRHNRAYSARRVQQIVQEYAAAAGIAERIHPHLFRHQMLTWLTAQGLPDAAIQLISGHSSRKGLRGLPASLVLAGGARVSEGRSRP